MSMQRSEFGSCVRVWVLAFVFAPSLMIPVALTEAASRPEYLEPLPSDPAQEATLLEFVGEGYDLHDTAHFLVAYNTKRRDAIALTSRLERTYRSVLRMCERFDIEAKLPEKRLEVIFFKHQREYGRFASKVGFPGYGTYGLYHVPSNRSVFFDIETADQMVNLAKAIKLTDTNLDRMKTAIDQAGANARFVEVHLTDGSVIRAHPDKVRTQIEQTREQLESLDRNREIFIDYINRCVVQHETAHQVLFNTGLHSKAAANPKWLVEGLACLFETPPGRTGSGVGAVNQMRLGDFRKMLGLEKEDGRERGEVLIAAIEAEKITHPKKVIAESKQFNVRGKQAAEHYAIAWALTQYLLRTQSDTFATYVKEISERSPGRNVSPAEELALFEKHFGKVDNNFLERVGTYILGLAYRPSGMGLR